MEKPIKYLLDFAEQQGVSIDDVILLLQEHKNLKKQQENEIKAFPVSEATAMIYNIDISINQYQMIRSICLPHGIHFPTRNAVDLFKHSL